MLNDLDALMRTLADWADRPGVHVILFGSRARGDHRPDSDVDVHIWFGPGISDSTAHWWSDANTTDFAALKAVLPGRLEICEGPPALHCDLKAATPTRVHRNISAVVLAPKPSG